LRTTMLESFLRPRKFSGGPLLFDAMLFAPMARGPLSSLPRDGGDVRGGSCDAFYLVAALPRWASVVNIPARKPGKTEKIDRPTTPLSAVAPSVKRARWHPTFGGGAARDRSRTRSPSLCVSLRQT